MKNLLEAFFDKPSNDMLFETFFMKDHKYIDTVRALCTGKWEVPSEGVFLAQLDEYHVLAFTYRVGDVRRCGFVYNEATDTCYVSTFGYKISSAAMEAINILQELPPASTDGRVNKMMLMMRKKDLGWAQFYWKNKKPAFSIGAESSQFPPTFCNDAANRVISKWGDEELCTKDCREVFVTLKELILKYFTRVTQYPGIGIMRTYVNDATDMQVLFCELDGEHIIINYRQIGVAVVSCFAGHYTCVVENGHTLREVADKVLVESPIQADVKDVAQLLGCTDRVAIQVYRALPEKSRADFLWNLKHSYGRHNNA